MVKQANGRPAEVPTAARASAEVGEIVPFRPEDAQTLRPITEARDALMRELAQEAVTFAARVHSLRGQVEGLDAAIARHGVAVARSYGLTEDSSKRWTVEPDGSGFRRTA